MRRRPVCSCPPARAPRRRADVVAHATPPRVDRGVTLIEAMVVVTVIGILLASAAPNVAAYLARQRVVTAANDLVHALAVTRAEALRRGRRVYVAPVNGHWHDGWIVFVDRNDNRVFDAAVDERLAQHDALPDSIVVTNPANAARESFTDVGSPQRTYVLFDGSGYARQRNGGFAAGSLTVADRGGGQVVVRTVCLASLGRVRIVEKASC